ncbi:MAG: TRAP transporter small permease [Oxalobacteraceae bacterium]|jgi:TRAP-type C4-dicarboxylate transport system permease small subunit|nr:TRAP transporter small permease [Oxalobacteraceae bacterium]
MQEPGLLDTEAEFSRGPLGEKLYEITRIFAIGGGLGFIALVVMSLISIVGRKLVSMPIPGDIEVMQMGTAVASAAMLAYCEMERHHLRVDFFTASVSPKTREILDTFSHLLLGLVAALIAWRTAVSAISIKEAGETSMILAWPVWVVVAAIVPSFALLALSGFYNAAMHWKSAASGVST